MQKQIAIVTGGFGGIGKAVTERLALDGFDVIAVDCDESKIPSFKEYFEAKGLLVDFYIADISTKTGVDSAVNYVLDKYKTVDVLVNNAGIDLYCLLSDTTDKQWNNIMNCNLYSCFSMSRAVIDTMVTNQSGCIINISSIWGSSGACMESVYAATKGAIASLSKSLSKELGPSNIRVNYISPGIIDTAMNADWTKEELDEIIEQIPLGRIGLPEEVADGVSYLAHATYVTGQELAINGGWYM